MYRQEQKNMTDTKSFRSVEPETTLGKQTVEARQTV